MNDIANDCVIFLYLSTDRSTKKDSPERKFKFNSGDQNIATEKFPGFSQFPQSGA